MNRFKYYLAYNDIPFDIDRAVVLRLDQAGHPKGPNGEDQQVIRKYQAVPDFVDELDRLLPFRYIEDMTYPGCCVNSPLHGIAQQLPPSQPPPLKIGEWFHPTGATRWSVFRGLASTTKAKAMLEATDGKDALPFTMKAIPKGAGAGGTDDQWTLSSYLYMLPPRTLAEHGGQFDGLYLITLVDERFYWQNTPVILNVTRETTWANLINSLANTLGVNIAFSDIPAVYGKPEVDSSLWCQMQNAAVMLDAVAYSIGRTVVRALDGTYQLLTPAESYDRVIANRGNIQDLTRHAGGDLFQSGGLNDFFVAKNSVIPTAVNVVFPKYVTGDDPVPHSVNNRYQPTRPSVWFESSPGDAYTVSVPVASGGALLSGHVDVSGLIGVSTQTVHTTAKALFNTEAAAQSGTPYNGSGLTALAIQIAEDYYGSQIAAALDEIYPGTFNLDLEGIHDVVWTYSAREREGSTRVVRGLWNADVNEMQHATPNVSGLTGIVGVGGPSVAQTIRDSYSGTISTTLVQTLSSGGAALQLATIDNFPTQQRFKVRVGGGEVAGGETLLLEGTSGTVNVGIVYRGYDGSTQQSWDNGTTVRLISPHTVYGVNLTTYGVGQHIYPEYHTSGGIQGVRIVPQTQTVQALTGSGISINSRLHYSGVLQVYDPSDAPGTEFNNEEYIWLVDRNGSALMSGSRYDGQFFGYSQSGTVAPVYGVNQGLTQGGQSGTLTVREVGTAGYTGIDTIEFDPNDRFAVSNPGGAGVARIDLTYVSGDLNASGLIVEGYQSGDTIVDCIRLQFINRDGFSVTNVPNKIARIGWSGGTGSTGIITKEVDGTPTINPTTTLEFLQSTGIGLSDQGGQTGRVYLSGIPFTVIGPNGGIRYPPYFRWAGTPTNMRSGGHWYFAGHPNEPGKPSFGGTFGVANKDIIYALPWYEGRGGYLDELAFWNNTTPTSGIIRMGIYTNLNDTQIYPGDLVLDTGPLLLGNAAGAGITGLQSWAVSGTHLSSHTLYWLVATFNWVGTFGPQMKLILMDDMWCPLGTDDLWSNTSTWPGWIGSGVSGVAIGGLPATYPTNGEEYIKTGTVDNAGLAMGIRYQA